MTSPGRTPSRVDSSQESPSHSGYSTLSPSYSDLIHYLQVSATSSSSEDEDYFIATASNYELAGTGAISDLPIESETSWYSDNTQEEEGFRPEQEELERRVNIPAEGEEEELARRNMENGGIASISSSDTETISAEEQDSNIAEDVEEHNPILVEDTDEENPNLAEEENPNLAENVNGLNATVGNSENAVDMEGFAENVVNDADERVSVAVTQGDDFQVAKRITGKGEGGGEYYMETQASDADAAIGCPICMEPWTSAGAHRISCLPCGHLFGWSCIKKWIQQGGKRIGKCPQCNKKCKFSEIRILYVPRVDVVDGEMQQELTLLRVENEKLKLENKKFTDERHQRMQEKAYCLDIKNLSIEKKCLLEDIQKLRGQRALLAATMPEQYGSPIGYRSTLFSDVRERRDYDFHGREACEPLSKRRLIDLGQGSTSSPFGIKDAQHKFDLKMQSVLNGGRHFDMDAFTQMLLVTQKASGMDGVHILTKKSFLSFAEGENINLPLETGAVRDLHIGPAGTRNPGRLALVASMGKKLSLVSFESNNVVVTYNLEVPVWSCAWDLNDPHTVYAGLQNGKLMIFDLRNTSSPTNTISGENKKPVHSLHSVAHFSGQNNVYGGRAVLGASCLGPLLWRFKDPHSSAFSIPGLEQHGACISLAYCGLSDIAVASYRPFVAPQVGLSPYGSQAYEATISSQFLSPEGIADPSSLSRAPRMGSHFVLTKNGRVAHQHLSVAGEGNGLGIEWNFEHEKVMHGNVSPVGITKSTIMTLGRIAGSKQSLFAYGDELNRAVALWDLQSLSSLGCLESHETSIFDVKHVQLGDQDILGCVSDTKVQIYACSKE